MSYRKTNNQNVQAHTRHATHAERHRKFGRLDAEATRLVREGKTDEEIACILDYPLDQVWIFTIRKRGSLP
jgi:hypothetical protein